ncbi:TAP-like protein-domain-containing protein [Xylaria palmicola]|nr:TAP-like protein-domain-containing protein [Xylaria palmicola]
MAPSGFPSLFRAATLALVATAYGKTTRGIPWKPCPADINAIAALDVECGTLAVPLDYTAANSTETLELSLLRVPAAKKQGKHSHSILFNFGGPGFESRFTLAQLADTMQAVTGGEHDLVAWDPRGTAETLTFSCFANSTARAQLSAGFTLGNASDVARGQLWAGGKNYADACAEYPEAQERGPLIGTPFTARDAMQIVNAVEDDGLLRYWGLSYGTDLGVMLAALFPERVEKLIIDGVFTPTQYFYDRTSSEGFASADDTFSEFFRQCVSTPDVCGLARSHPNATAGQLESAAYDLIEEIKYRPLAHDGLVLGYLELTSAIRFALYTPYTWLALDRILDAFFATPRNETLAGAALADYLAASLAGDAPADDAPIGIECVDQGPRSDSFDVINAALDRAQSVSRLLGDVLAGGVTTCAQWKLEPRERYTAGFAGVKPRKPLFVIGNTYDSATSIKSARNITETIEGSVLLEHGGFGHTSIQQPSLCTARAIQNFFRNGTLPESGTLCDTATGPFQFTAEGPTWQDLYAQLGFEPPSAGNGTKAARAERRGGAEMAMLKNMGRRLGGAF